LAADPPRFHVTLTFELEVEATTAERALRRAKRRVRAGGEAQVTSAEAVKIMEAGNG